MVKYIVEAPDASVEGFLNDLKRLGIIERYHAGAEPNESQDDIKQRTERLKKLAGFWSDNNIDARKLREESWRS